MSAHDIDVAVIGAGVVGLAIAAEIASAGRSVCVLERHPRAGMETSTHNSGVIHAGIYYPPGTLKAQLCVEGRDRLYAFCAEHAIPHTRSGKLIVAADASEVPALEALETTGLANGVDDLRFVDASFVREREPHVAAVAALLSPSTGVVWPEGVVHALRHICDRHGAAWLPGTALVGAEASADRIELVTARERITAALVINAAGLYADEVSAMIGGEAFTIYPGRGEYAELAPSRRHLVKGLVYPVPHKPDTAWAHTSCRRWTARSSWGPHCATRPARRTTRTIGCRSRRSSTPPGGCCQRSQSTTSVLAVAGSARSSARRNRRSSIS